MTNDNLGLKLNKGYHRNFNKKTAVKLDKNLY